MFFKSSFNTRSLLLLVSYSTPAGELYIRASLGHASPLCRRNRHISSFFFYYSFISVFFMNSDCSSSVMTCLCIGVAYDCVSGTRSHTWRRTKSTQAGKYISFTFLNHVSPWWWRQTEACVKIKKKTLWSVSCFCFISLFYSKVVVNMLSSVFSPYCVTKRCVCWVSVQHSDSDQPSNTYCMLVASLPLIKQEE